MAANFYYNCLDEECKRPFGALRAGHDLSLTVFSRDGVFIDRVVVVLKSDADGSETEYPMIYKGKEDGVSRYDVSFRVGSGGLYFYHFRLETEWGVEERYADENDAPWQLTVFSSSYKTPDRFKGGLVYQIFVDRFNKGKDRHAVFDKKNGVLKEWDDPLTVCDPDGVYRANDFYGGNLQGIIDKLSYLKQLGVTLIYLTPIFESSSNHRYDTGDYMKLDRLVGDEEKFRQLIEMAANRGIGVILDGVFNHTGADSKYFNKFGNYPGVGAYQSEKSPYHNWYYFEEFPDKYRCWWGVTVSPTLNKSDPSLRRMMLHKGGVIRKWTDMGIAGWRLDVVDELEEDYVRSLRRVIKQRDKDKLIIGEVWEDASNKISYGKRRHYLLGGELDGVMNYVFKDAIIDFVCGGDSDTFMGRIGEIMDHYPKRALDNSFTLLGSHDTARIKSVLSGRDVSGLTKEEKLNVTLTPFEEDIAKRRLKLAAVLQYTLPGNPMIYYGDERGMEGYEDPTNRKTVDWKHRDEDIFALYKKLGRIRKKYSSVFRGTTYLETGNGMAVFHRMARSRELTVLVNSGNTVLTYYIDGKYVDLLTDREYDFGDISIAPMGAMILAKKN